MASVELSSRAVGWLRDAEPDLRERVERKLRDAGNFPEHYLRRLSGYPFYRLRIGDYRAIIEWRRDQEVLFVREIDHRDAIYE